MLSSASLKLIDVTDSLTTSRLGLSTISRSSLRFCLLEFDNEAIPDDWKSEKSLYRAVPGGIKGGGADVPLFETIKTNAGTQPKNELQQ